MNFHFCGNWFHDIIVNAMNFVLACWHDIRFVYSIFRRNKGD